MYARTHIHTHFLVHTRTHSHAHTKNFKKIKSKENLAAPYLRMEMRQLGFSHLSINFAYSLHWTFTCCCILFFFHNEQKIETVCMCLSATYIPQISSNRINSSFVLDYVINMHVQKQFIEKKWTKIVIFFVFSLIHFFLLHLNLHSFEENQTVKYVQQTIQYDFLFLHSPADVVSAILVQNC